MFCTTNGIRIHYVRTAGAKPHRLLQGLTGSGACWAPDTRALEARTRTTRCYSDDIGSTSSSTRTPVIKS